MAEASNQNAPVSGNDRVGALDALRGFALLGVLIANLTGFGGVDTLATTEQLDSLPSAGLDTATQFLVDWLVHDKANTLFAFLFGVGFWIQLERLRSRGSAAERIYLRRLLILLVFGLAHFYLLWPWDVLHLYAATGLVLFAFRKAGDRTLLIGGLVLAVFGRFIADQTLTAAGISGPAFDAAYSDEAILARQAASQSGDYFAWIAATTRLTTLDWWASGLALSWFVYVLGRFMVGAWVARRGWFQRAAELKTYWRRWALVAVPLGLTLEFAAVSIDFAVGDERLAEAPWEVLASFIHLLALPVLAAGYACMVVTATSKTGPRPVTQAFAQVGRMALTNYVIQSFIIGFILLGVGPGLALAGRAGATLLLVLALLAFAAQVVLSALWLRHFAFGPLEWVWRALTYGKAPRLRRARAAFH